MTNQPTRAKVTRKDLVAQMVPKVVGTPEFRYLRGITLDQFGSFLNMILDARNEAIKELQKDGLQ